MDTLGGFNSEHELEMTFTKIVKLADELFLERQVEDIRNLLEQEYEELTNEERIELEKECVEEERE